jgi:hypothetical protein
MHTPRRCRLCLDGIDASEEVIEGALGEGNVGGIQRELLRDTKGAVVHGYGSRKSTDIGSRTSDLGRRISDVAHPTSLIFARR